MSSRVLFRVDADPAIGSGHLMRCLALAAQLRARGCAVAFVSRIEPEPLREKVRAADFELLDAPARLEGLPLPAQWVVLDGYKFGLAEQRAVKALDVRLMVIDDMAMQDEYCADLVLNQNVGEGRVAYPGAARALLGPGYAMLRPEFAAAPRGAQARGSAKRILLTLGGGAPPQVAQVLFTALGELGLPLHVRALGVAPEMPAVSIGSELECLPYVDDMPAQMAWADLALCAGGSTCWELACMGVPALITVLSRDQKMVVEQMTAADCAVSLGWHEDLTPASVVRALKRLLAGDSALLSMRQNGPRLVDGLGAARVAEALLEEKQ